METEIDKGRGQASVIDVTERKVVATVPVGKGPNGISMAP